jgi:hypothetical protein
MESSTFGRLIGALVSPGKTFRSIAERPTWLVAFLVVVLSPVVPAMLAVPKMDWEGIVKANLERMDVQVPQEQVDQQVAITEKIGGFMTYVSPLMIAVLVLAMALVFWGAFTLAGGEAGFKRTLAVTSHAMMPFVVLQLLSIPMILRLSTIGAEDIETGSYLRSNLAAFAPEGANPIVMSLLGKIDVFSIWIVVLLVIGFIAAARVKSRTAAIVVLLLWLFLWVGTSVGFAGLGMMMAGRSHG